jgi:hypothetical protein
MKKIESWKDMYSLPLHKTDYISWVYDKRSNFVFQFEPKFVNGDYAKGYLEFENNVLNKLNGGSHKFESEFTSKHGEIFYKHNHIITIRGWGNLTGIGAHNLPAETAALIQDTFCDWIIETLNK